MITSTNNTRIKEIVQLQKKRKLRDTEGVFVVEGIRMFREIPTQQLVEIFVTETFYDENKELFIEIENQYKQIKSDKEQSFTEILKFVSTDVFLKISETKSPQGILCIVRRRKCQLVDILEQDEKRIMVLETVQDPGNVGTIIRTAEAAGVTGIILSKDCADIYQSKTIRSTMGAIFRMQCVYVESLQETLNEMKTQGITLYGTHLEGAKWHNKVTYAKDTAVLIGNEGNGLTKTITDMVDVKIKIPMAGEVESLNAGIAASIVMYEVYLQKEYL